MLTVSTLRRSATTTATIQSTSWTRRRYQPETRAIVSSYQVSADLRKSSTFFAASSFAPSASSRSAVSASRTRSTGNRSTDCCTRSSASSTVAAASSAFLDVEAEERRDHRSRRQVRGDNASDDPTARRTSELRTPARAYGERSTRDVETFHQLVAEQALRALPQVVGPPRQDARDRLHDRRADEAQDHEDEDQPERDVELPESRKRNPQADRRSAPGGGGGGGGPLPLKPRPALRHTPCVGASRRACASSRGWRSAT